MILRSSENYIDLRAVVCKGDEDGMGVLCKVLEDASVLAVVML